MGAECSNCGENLGHAEIEDMVDKHVSKEYWVCYGCDQEARD